MPRRVLRAVPNDAAIAHAGGTAQEVALTFDDGPGLLTARILDELQAGRAHGTFFVIGRQLHGHDALLRRILAAGDDLGDHLGRTPTCSSSRSSGGASSWSCRSTRWSPRRACGPACSDRRTAPRAEGS